MDINLRAKLNAQVYAGAFINRYMHIISLYDDNDSIVYIQLPMNMSKSIESVEEFKELFTGLVGENKYPCSGVVDVYARNAYCIRIVGDAILVNDQEFVPQHISDFVI